MNNAEILHLSIVKVAILGGRSCGNSPGLRQSRVGFSVNAVTFMMSIFTVNVSVRLLKRLVNSVVSLAPNWSYSTTIALNCVL